MVETEYFVPDAVTENTAPVPKLLITTGDRPVYVLTVGFHFNPEFNCCQYDKFGGV